MVTMEATPSLRDFIAFKLANKIAKTDRASKVANPRTWVQATVRLMLHVVGLASLTMAGFSWSIIAGLIVGGFACFVLAWLTAPSSATVPPTTESPEFDATHRLRR